MTSGLAKNPKSNQTSPHASWNFRRGNASVRLLVQLGIDHGLTVDQVLQGTALTPASLEDLKGEIEATDELAVITNLVRLLPHVPGLGLEAGSRYRLTTYGIWGYALISSPTLHSAAHLALRYLNLTYAFTHISMQAGHGITSFTLGDLEVPAEVRRFVVERDAVAVRVLQKDIFQSAIPLHRIAFKGAAPSYAHLYVHYFGVEPEFNAPYNRAEFPSHYLDLPLPQANENTVAMCEDICRDLVNQRRSRHGCAAVVRNRLLHTPGKLPDMETIAAEMCMTSRTLRRHLVAEGTTFRDLVDEVRLILALELIETAHMGHKEIALRLGFHDLSSFIQAFRRWKGVTPSVYRSQLGLPVRVTRSTRMQRQA
ncbi:MAG: AraC family transcriptional regulator [Burkholderiales bacterium]|nr:AraC family transcriptional regulator [Burkholderiales bacterium]MDE2076907.1 AraC family transcriptional regulator [Burkholderiales bacterium]MDE2431744.1 AraC family transcriptional regulator [Burkholderiales bacterium]